MQISEDMFRFLALAFFCFDGIVFFSNCFAQDASSESDLFFPQLELTTIRVEMSQSSLDSLLDGETNDISNHSYHASIHYESSGINSTLNNIGVRLRGNTSLNSPKKSFKLDFNAFIEYIEEILIFLLVIFSLEYSLFLGLDKLIIYDVLMISGLMNEISVVIIIK